MLKFNAEKESLVNSRRLLMVFTAIGMSVVNV